MNPENPNRAEEPPTATLGSTSQTLLDRISLGSEADRRLLITLYSSLVLNLYIDKRVVQDIDDRRDITNRVFRTVFRRIEGQGFERQACGAFRGWLKIITRNKVGDFIRQARRRENKVRGLAEQWDLPPILIESDDDGATGPEAERTLLVRQAIEAVRAEFELSTYEMARLQLMEGRTAAEAGAVYGKSANSAYIAKFRVKRQLREILDRFEFWDFSPNSSEDHPGAPS